MEFFLFILVVFSLVGVIFGIANLAYDGKWRKFFYRKDTYEMIYDGANGTYKIVRYYNHEHWLNGIKRKRETIYWFSNDEEAVEKMAEITEGLRRAKQFNKMLK
jgi:hypothetical protein